MNRVDGKMEGEKEGLVFLPLIMHGLGWLPAACGEVSH